MAISGYTITTPKPLAETSYGKAIQQLTDIVAMFQKGGTIQKALEEQTMGIYKTQKKKAVADVVSKLARMGLGTSTVGPSAEFVYERDVGGPIQLGLTEKRLGLLGQEAGARTNLAQALMNVPQQNIVRTQFTTAPLPSAGQPVTPARPTTTPGFTTTGGISGIESLRQRLTNIVTAQQPTITGGGMISSQYPYEQYTSAMKTTQPGAVIATPSEFTKIQQGLTKLYGSPTGLRPAAAKTGRLTSAIKSFVGW